MIPPKDKRVVFLDIDGVLNDHRYDEIAESNTILPRCVAELNRVILFTDAHIVLSSAWRYQILGGATTLKGFEYLLRTHGVHCKDRLLDHTPSDEDIPLRGDQIRHWLNENGGHRNYIVVDDGGLKDGKWFDMGINAAGLKVEWIDGKVGLTRANAERMIIDLLC